MIQFTCFLCFNCSSNLATPQLECRDDQESSDSVKCSDSTACADLDCDESSQEHHQVSKETRSNQLISTAVDHMAPSSSSTTSTTSSSASSICTTTATTTTTMMSVNRPSCCDQPLACECSAQMISDCNRKRQLCKPSSSLQTRTSSVEKVGTLSFLFDKIGAGEKPRTQRYR